MVRKDIHRPSAIEPADYMTYFVVENAGYEGERFVYRSADFIKVFKWMCDRYTVEERDDLHVDIALERKDGSLTYEY